MTPRLAGLAAGLVILSQTFHGVAGATEQPRAVDSPLVLATEGPSPSPSATYDDGLDAKLRIENPISPLGSYFRAIGTSSCQKTYVTLEFRDYSGQPAYVAKQVPVTFTRSDGYYHFDYRFVIPDVVAPGDGYSMHADPYCGDPNAGASDQQPVTVKQAVLHLNAPASVAAGSKYSISGSACYGPADRTSVDLVVSGPSTQRIRAPLRGHAFTATAEAFNEAAVLRSTVSSDSCPGSSAATATTRVVGSTAVVAPTPGSASGPSPTRVAASAVPVASSVSPPTTQGSSAMPSASVSPGVVTAVGGQGHGDSASSRGLIVLLLALTLAGGVGGAVAAARRRSRPGTEEAA